MTMLRNVNIPETLTTDPYGFASRSWGATAVLGSPQVEQVAWEPPLSGWLTTNN